jgi:signal transduction histidine kinase
MQSTGTMIIDVPTKSVEAPARSTWWLIRRRPTLAVQFLIASLIVLVAGMAVIGSWVGAQIEAGVLDHDGATAAFLVDSVISPRLQVLAAKTRLDDADIAQTDWLMDATLRGRRVVEVKIWSTDGTVLYSRRNPPLIGQHFGVDEDLGQALRGEVNANISDLRDAENEYERHDFSRLLQVYVPIHHNSDGHLRTLQEALSNATRHGRAEEPIEVELRTESESLQMTVTDHGRGFDVAHAQQGDCLGLVGMRERAELLGGTFDIRSRPGAGTRVHTSWPLAAREETWPNQSESS